MTRMTQIFFAFVALLAFAVPASAQDLPSPSDFSDLFGDGVGDPYSSVLLNQMFGPLFPSATGVETTTVFSEIIGYFNVIILVVGGLMFFYNVTVGILQSAHEGQVLGQRWSSLWAPLRVLFAVGLMVPVPDYGGYNLAQVGVAYLVKGSTKMASTVWVESANLVLDKEVPFTAPTDGFSPEAVVGLYKNAACLSLMQYQQAQVSDGSVSVGYFDKGDLVDMVNADLHPRFAEQNAMTGRDGMNTAIVSDSGEVRLEGICGGWETPEVPDYIDRQIANAEDDSAAQDAAEQLRTDFTDGHYAIMQDLATRAQNDIWSTGNASAPISDDIFQQTETSPVLITEDIVDTIEHANNEFESLNEDLRDRARALQSNYDARDLLLDRISGGESCIIDEGPGTGSGPGGTTMREGVGNCYGEGWMGAGSWYMIMARINNELVSLMDAKPRVFGATMKSQGTVYEELGGETGAWWTALGFGERNVNIDRLPSEEEATRIMTRYDEQITRSSATLAALGIPMGTDAVTQLSMSPGGMDHGDEMISRIGLADKLPDMNRTFIEFFDPSNRASDPMVGLINVGNSLINTGMAIAVVAVFGGALSAGVAIVCLPLFSVFITAGMTLSFILPVMPFMYWILGITGYFLLIVEAIVAVNLWALGHMRMDGDGISGEAGRNGWLMILSLLMTPVLMVFGFLIGMLIFRVTSDLISAGMFYAAQGVAGGNLFIQLGGLLAFSVMIVMFYALMLERSFTLISSFPGLVMRWIGANVQLDNDETRVRAAAAAGTAGLNRAANWAEPKMLTRKEGQDGSVTYGGLGGALNRGMKKIGGNSGRRGD